jgi:peptidoglycan-associated lipoprotein
MKLSARGALAGTVAAAMFALGGCARVSPDELSVELAQLREEMRQEYAQGDQKVATDLSTRIDGLDARLDALAGELDELGETFEVTVERMESAIRFNAPVHFAFDDATVRPSDREVLDRFAGVIKTHYPDVLITAEGFTDPVGSVEYNRALGLKRAEAVVSYLTTEGGLEGTRLRAVSYGEETQRLMDDKRGPGEAGVRNRRVVLVIEGSATAEEMAAPTATNGSSS